MFTNERYLTCGVDSTIPIELQLFNLQPSGAMQRLTHTSEEPEYHMVYLIPSDAPITAKIYIIDDGDHSTMLLAEEY